MSSELLLRARGVTKQYTSVLHPFVRLRQVLFGLSPKAGEAHEVLKQVDLDIYRGETLGLIGRNGAGKTTLLGILGKVIEPTSGTIVRHCRMATLLELTAGFNPQFSGRENAYLFCTIHGLSRSEANERMEVIERFADLGSYFDLPIRTYSSGMQARLGFACAVHVEADVIIIDETLAVGDAAFRMKCYDMIHRMQGKGQTFLVVSHNQNVIANYCTRAIVLDRGEKIYDGTPFGALETYKRIRVESTLQHQLTEQSADRGAGQGEGVLTESLSLSQFVFKEELDHNGVKVGVIEARLVARQSVRRPAISLGIRSHEGVVLCSYHSADGVNPLPPIAEGESKIVRMTFANRLCLGTYFVSAATYELMGDVAVQRSLHQNVVRFSVTGRSDATGLVDLDMRIELVPDASGVLLPTGGHCGLRDARAGSAK